MKRTINLPENIEIVNYDIKENLFAFCNLYEVGLVFLGIENNPNQMEEEGSKNISEKNYCKVTLK